MSVDERIDALKAKHQALENAIEEENSRPLPDDAAIVGLKKQKTTNQRRTGHHFQLTSGFHPPRGAERRVSVGAGRVRRQGGA